MNSNYEDWWYNKIIREHAKARNNSYEMLWISKILKKLMFLLNTTQDTILVRNSLILLLNLIEDLPLDRFEKRGKDLKYLSLKEKNELKRLLKDTFV
ncbi:MAG: hypothetical protein ACFFFB_07140 [Candidatus Heimdallarchaeota archaeon]